MLPKRQQSLLVSTARNTIISTGDRCVRLPDVLEAYDGTGSYTDDQRQLLLDHLEDPDQRKHPWPAKLDSAFGIEDPESIQESERGVTAALSPSVARDANAATASGRMAGDVGSSSSSAGCVSETTAAGASNGASSPKGGSMPGSGGSAAGGRVRVGGSSGGNSGRGSRSGKGGKSNRNSRAGFGGKCGAAAGGMTAAGGGGVVLLGSPMVDATLEDTQGLLDVIIALKEDMGISTDGDGGMGGEGKGALKMEVRLVPKDHQKGPKGGQGWGVGVDAEGVFFENRFRFRWFWSEKQVDWCSGDLVIDGRGCGTFLLLMLADMMVL